MALNAQQIADRVKTLRSRNHDRDQAMDDILAIREGRWEEVYPGLFPEKFPRPMVANLIDTVASDLAQEIAPLPTFACKTAESSDRQKKASEKRTKIVNYYVDTSNLQTQMFAGADRLLSYGFVALMVDVDRKKKCPKILVDNTHRAYYQNDLQNTKTLHYVRVFSQYVDVLAMQFPDASAELMKNEHAKNPYGTTSNVEVMVYRWWDEDQEALVTEDGIQLARRPHAIPGRCPVRVVEMPKLGERPKGQYDDVIWVQGARALAQVYLLQAMDESVNAPIAVPNDVQEFAYGPGEILRSDEPEKVRRINLPMEGGLFAQLENMTNELRLGARYPEGRSGNIDASIITGQGVEALQGSFTAQKTTAQLMLRQGLRDILALALEYDESLWPQLRKSVVYNQNREQHEVTYIPSRDIAGSYSVDVSYGLVGGLDPSRGLVYVLQAHAGGLISLETAREELPVDLDVRQEKIRINTELIESSVISAIAGYSQTVPMQASNGMDPSAIVGQIAELYRLIKKGEDPAEAWAKVFPEAPEQPEAPAEDPLAALMGGGGAGPEAGGGAPVPGSDLGAGGGQANDLLMSLVGLTPGGSANLQSTVSRRTPIPA